jgi:predicted DNA binding CopG/RHH family protein
MKKNKHEITDYDETDTTPFINPTHKLSLSDLHFSLPKEGVTKVVSIRLPTKLYKNIKAISTEMDISYQGYIKYLLNEGVARTLRSGKQTNPSG